MAYNTVSIKKDVDNKPIPQLYDALKDAYEVLQGRNGANRVELFDSGGNAIDIATLLTSISTLLTAIKDTAGIKKITDALPAGTNTLGGIKVVGNDALIQGNLSLTGAAQQLPSQAAKVITIQSEPMNDGYIYIGKSGVSSSAHMATLSPGSSMTFYVSNLNLLYVIGEAGDKICYGGEV